jgi:hypothetical protein
MRTFTIVTMLAVLALVFDGCASSDEERCKKEGGVWRSSMCERQARETPFSISPPGARRAAPDQAA